MKTYIQYILVVKMDWAWKKNARSFSYSPRFEWMQKILDWCQSAE